MLQPRCIALDVDHIALSYPLVNLFFFFNDTATTEIYTLSLHDALPISFIMDSLLQDVARVGTAARAQSTLKRPDRSEEHTSELQSRLHLVCRLLLEKKKKTAGSPQAESCRPVEVDHADDRRRPCVCHRA